jgi:hypothetical protein
MIFAEIPHQADAVLRARLPGSVGAVNLAGIGAALTVENGHPIFNLDLDRIAAGDGLEGAYETGIRYLLNDERGTAVAAAELRTDDNGTSWQFDQVNAGPFVQATVDTLTQAETELGSEDASFNVRLLRIPGLYIMAVWLAPQDSKDTDRIIAINPAPDYIEPGRVYLAADFLAALREPAQSRLAAFERLHPTSPA